MRALAEEPLTDEMRESFEKERRLNNQLVVPVYAQFDDMPNLQKQRKKGKGEKRRAKRNARKYGYVS